jgi:2-polyprenyl-6-methoxyphenol hydroxylase-like FAD-dependent oxidoreductase
VLEKHADFLRDFRGDTIHPSTLNLMGELGLLDAFLALPHQKVFHLEGWIGDFRATIADFSSLPGPCNFIAIMPQWDFLDFLADRAKALAHFKLMMRTEAKELIVGAGGIAGLVARGPDGALKIRADLTIAADGRHSLLPDQAGLKRRDLGAPMDVLWFRLSRRESDGADVVGRFANGRILIRINRGDYWQWVGINLAVQDAVAAANALAAPLLEGRLTEDDLGAVERRRLFPVKVVQRGQIFIQNRIIAPTLEADQSIKPPLALRFIARSPLLRRWLARLVGLGVRPEHILTPAAQQPPTGRAPAGL